MIQNTVKNNLVILNSFRGLAAIYVLFGHARWLLWEGYQEGYKLHPESYSLFNKICMYAFSVFKFGHEAVIFFFVLSGFVIHWSSSIRIDKKDGKFDIVEYLKKRITRIYPPFIIALVLTFVLDYIGKEYFKFPMYFSNTRYASINDHVSANHDILTLVGSLLFVHTVYTKIWGTNGALWSLMYEWWFYILYIPVLYFFRKNKILTSLVIISLWLIDMKFSYGPFLYTKVMGYFLVWYLGMVLADFILYPDKKIYFYSFLAIVLISASFFHSERYGFHTLLGVGITLLLLAVLTTNAFSFLKKVNHWGEFSYTLYAIHVPILRLFSGFTMSNNNGYLPMHFGYVMLGASVSLVVGYCLHFVGERPFTTRK